MFSFLTGGHKVESVRSQKRGRNRRRAGLQSLERRMVLSGIGLGGDSGSGRFFLADTDSNETLAEITDGSVISTDLVEGRRVTVFAIDNPDNPESSEVDSARLTLNDGLSRVESFAPYALSGDRNGDFFNGMTFQPGEYNLEVEFFDRNGARGNLIEAVDLAFRISDLPEFQDLRVKVLRSQGQSDVQVFTDEFLTEPSSEQFFVAGISGATNGSVTAIGEGSGLRYTADPSFVGTEVLNVTIGASNVPTETVTVQLTVEVTKLPQMRSVAKTIVADAGIDQFFVTATQFVINDPQARVFFFETPESNLGQFGFTGEAFALTFAPDPNASGTETIEVKIWNQENFDDVVTVELIVTVI
ncbi:MAG: hypothetical protein AAF802_06685 [Planctomycetota bacterium]